MKIVLVVLIFYFFINLISAFSWFSFRSNQQPKQITDSSSSHRPTFHFQRSAFRKQKHLRNVTNSLRQTIIASNKNNANHLPPQRTGNRRRHQFRNTTAAQRQADSINKKSSQIIPQNRFQAIVYQQQHRSLNKPLVFRQANHAINNTNNPIVHPRSRSFLPTGKNNSTDVSSVNRGVFPPASLTKSFLADSKPNSSSNIKTNIQSYRSRLAFAKAIVTSTKTGLLRVLTTQATGNKGSRNRQHLLANFYYQQRLRTFDQGINKQNPARNHSNINTALKQRRRQDKQEDERSNPNYRMIFVRDTPSNQENHY